MTPLLLTYRGKVVGPFDNTERAGFDKVFPLEQRIDLEAEYDGNSGPVKWQDAESEQEDLKQLGYVDLNAALVEEKNVLGYAFTTFVVAEDMQVECRYETIEATFAKTNRPIFGRSPGSFDFESPTSLAELFIKRSNRVH